MKLYTIKNTLKGIGFGLLMAVGVAAFASTEARAQYRDRSDRQERRDDRRERRDERSGRYSNPLYQIARENGFQDGQQKGREDRRDRDRDNPQRSNEYRRATNGYYPRLGSRDEYRNVYRQAFLQGYDSTYRGGTRNGNRNWGY